MCVYAKRKRYKGMKQRHYLLQSYDFTLFSVRVDCFYLQFLLILQVHTTVDVCTIHFQVPHLLGSVQLYTHQKGLPRDSCFLPLVLRKLSSVVSVMFLEGHNKKANLSSYRKGILFSPH